MRRCEGGIKQPQGAPVGNIRWSHGLQLVLLMDASGAFLSLNAQLTLDRALTQQSATPRGSRTCLLRLITAALVLALQCPTFSGCLSAGCCCGAHPQLLPDRQWRPRRAPRRRGRGRGQWRNRSPPLLILKRRLHSSRFFLLCTDDRCRGCGLAVRGERLPVPGLVVGKELGQVPWGRVGRHDPLPPRCPRGEVWAVHLLPHNSDMFRTSERRGRGHFEGEE